jgi:hypothetical protein
LRAEQSNSEAIGASAVCAAEALRDGDGRSLREPKAVDMSYLKGTLAFAAILWGGLFAFAFAAAQKSCEWGWDTYFWVGIAVVLVLMATPILGTGLPYPKRALFSLGLGVFTIAVWFGGLFAAPFKILCRLF